MRQVTHALLTRPPLSHKSLHSEKICLKCFVRLACVKHAASVHPEPGSNSQIEICIRQDSAWLIRSRSAPYSVRVLLLCVPSLKRLLMNIQKNIQELYLYLIQVSSENFMNFQGCFTVQLSKYGPVSLPGNPCCLAPLIFVSPVRQRILSYQNFSHLSTLF